MKKILLSVLCCFVFVISFAQKSGNIKGIVFDTIAKQPVSAATITVLQRKDSSLVTFTMTNSRGEFTLTNVLFGDYRLLVTHVNYHNVNKYFEISDSKKDIDLTNIELSDKNKVLEEVVVQAEAPPVTLIGDTVQYNAGSFKTKPNAVVEDLLKKMPGIQVEKDGTVKAQGQEVKKVLVDGKEFFGNDPKIATKNLPADAVDKVQVYDRQSDMAQLTGFDDGQSEKTINLKLKKDKKKGVFGKVSAGGGTEGRYQGRFNVNSFKGARQMSVIGMGNNTNAEGFSFMDMLNFSGGMSQLGAASGGGNINISMSSNDAIASAMGGGNNNAINTSWAGGANYNNIVGTKMEVQSNYFFNRYNPVTDQKLSRQYILPDSTYFYNQDSRTNNLSYSHRFNLTYDYLIDSLHSLKFTPSLSWQDRKNRSFSKYETLSEQLVRSNSGFNDNYTASNGYNFSGTLLFRKKFDRKGRTFSINIGSTLNNSDGNGELESLVQLYNRQGNLARSIATDQNSVFENELRSYNTRAVYTEPLLKRSLLELSVSKNESNSISDKVTYDYNNTSGKHDIVNPAQTNNYENTYGTMTAGIRIRTQKKKYNYSFGLTWQNADLEGAIKSGIKDSVIAKSFYNLLPNARFQYNFTRFKNLQLDYRASTNQPSVSQLQPIPDISDRPNIRLGNPNLVQEYTHRINVTYTGMNPFRNKSFFWFSTYSFTNNKIVNFDIVDTFKTTTYVNVDGVYNLMNDISVGWPLKFMKGTLNFNTGIGYSKTIQFINSVRNNIYNISIDPNIEITKSFKDKFDLTAGAGFTYNKAKYSLQSTLNNNYFTQDYSLDIGWQLPKNFYLSTDFRYTISTNRSKGFNAKVPLWNASFSKLFLKYNRGELKLSVFDLLNENQAIVRNTNSNYIEDQNNRVLKRFFLLGFTYSLNKMSANAGGPGRGNIIIRR